MQLFDATGSLLFTAFSIFVIVGGIMLLLSFFLKNRLVLVLTTLVIVSGMVFLFIDSQRTTFEEFYFDPASEGFILERATLIVNDVSASPPEAIMSLSIEDEETLKALANDFAGLELYDDDLRNRAEAYSLSLRVTEPEGDGRRNEFINVSDTHINSFEVRPPFAHLQTIEALVNDESLDWIMEEDD
ncbi:hypothetical protein FLK61_24485 [Paenalkalicoccus suaedae]|uniref:Uncharacterized protein n=1 Tax=Paenalkalicoccus suaedae TaxID=2592382 RepID=A0A859FBA0_9BACI|nr:hypothetical protein [Paenalkalicoccus suaedae]QKS69941.1 hypothetical protein FLK61_24485 [Paenalkalicoccus suaedae]